MMTRTVTVYVPVGSIHGDKIGYPTHDDAKTAVESLAGFGWYPNGWSIEPRSFEIAENRFWTGDLISVELHRGGVSDDDGIHRGGKWTSPVHGVAHVTTVSLIDGKIEGYMTDTDGRFVQSLELEADRPGFPCRNAKLIQRANEDVANDAR